MDKKSFNIDINVLGNKGKKLYIETYGCQMNVSDSEVVTAILLQQGFEYTHDIKSADVILVNTCSVRDNAEQRVHGRLNIFKQLKKKKPEMIIGVIGCMAERMKEELLEKQKIVDIVVGPDAYRDLPLLLKQAGTGHKAVNVLLSIDETYADINPVRLDENKISAFVTIMRGCNNLCAYCIVPFTRGSERSRDPQTILEDIKNLSEQGYKEITLLGQNVDSYHCKQEDGSMLNFAQLLELTAIENPNMRIRFATSHPKDMTDEVLHVMSRHKNICKSIHLPVQSGSTRMLEKMNRRYTREWYLSRITAIKNIVPDCSLSADIISGFCGETEADHADTLSLLELVGYDYAFMFKYNVRPGTYAADHYQDDVPEEVKSRRLTEIIEMQRKLSEQRKKHEIGKIKEVLVEGISKKSDCQLYGRSSQNDVIVFDGDKQLIRQYVHVKITACTSGTLLGEIVNEQHSD